MSKSFKKKIPVPRKVEIDGKTFYAKGIFSFNQVNRVVYIWGRYEGTRDATKEGKHYDKGDLTDLIRRLTRFRDNPNSFNEGFEKKENEDD